MKRERSINGVCGKCGERKDFDDFGLNSDPCTVASHPWNYVCKQCVDKRRRERHQEKLLEKVNAFSSAWFNL